MNEIIKQPRARRVWRRFYQLKSGDEFFVVKRRFHKLGFVQARENWPAKFKRTLVNPFMRVRVAV